MDYLSGQIRKVFGISIETINGREGKTNLRRKIKHKK